MESIPGLLPGEVASYDPDARTCRVRIPGLTDGSNVLPEAVFNNPLGDRSDDGNAKSHTEILIKPNDLVWLMFECGDPRFPIIMGTRTKRAGNPSGWRRWHHANIEMTADGEMILNASALKINVTGAMTTTVGGAMDSTAGTSTHASSTHDITATTSITGNTLIAGGIAMTGGAGGTGVTIQGPIAIEGGTVTHNGKNIGSTHVHIEHDAGGPTDPPQ